MILNPPFSISSRLLPALEVGGATLSLNPRDVIFHLDLPDGSEHTIDDFRPGASNGDIADWFASMLAFLGAAAESRRYRERKGGTEIDPDSNEGLFDPATVDWAAANSDEIAMMEYEIEESEEELITD